MNGTVADFGVVTACCAKDYFLVKATCASIRHYCADVPICVVVDGDFDVGELVRTYGVLTLRTADLRDPVMRRFCSGSPRAKHAAMWCGPFERFLYLDSDAIVWGDVLRALDWAGEDFIVCWKPVTEPVHPSWLSHFYFDHQLLAEFDPTFDWRGHPYFSAGVFAARRGALSLEAFLEAEEWRRRSPALFSWTTDQGILNYLVFRSAASGRLSYRVCDVQMVPAWHGKAAARSDLPCSLATPPRSVERPWVIHFCDGKPLIQNRRMYTRPFTAFRLLHYRQNYEKRGLGTARAWMRVLCEEAVVLASRAKRKLRRRLGR